MTESNLTICIPHCQRAHTRHRQQDIPAWCPNAWYFVPQSTFTGPHPSRDLLMSPTTLSIFPSTRSVYNESRLRILPGSILQPFLYPSHCQPTTGVLRKHNTPPSLWSVDLFSSLKPSFKWIIFTIIKNEMALFYTTVQYSQYSIASDCRLGVGLAYEAKPQH